MVETVAKPLCAKLLLLTWIPHSFSWTSFTCNMIFTKFVFTNSFFCEGNILRQKKLTYSEISWKIKLRSRWVFFSILFMTAVIWKQKKYMVTWYLLNRKWSEVRIKTTLVSSNIDCHRVGYSKVTCRWVSDDFYRFLVITIWKAFVKI